MINVKKTIFKSLKHWIDQIIKLANNNSVALRKVLYLIILDDLLDWADYLDQPQSIQKKLKDMRFEFIDQNKEIKPIIDTYNTCDYYTNVNTPQTNNTWRRLCDENFDDVSEGIIKACLTINPDHHIETHNLPYKNLVWSVNKDEIQAELGLMTNEEKMDWYVDNFGQLWFLDPNTCTWKRKADEITPEAEKYINIAYSEGNENERIYTISENKANIVKIMGIDELEGLL